MLIMELIVFIGLTIWAWNRGWKGWSLLPVGIGILTLIIVGLIITLVGFTDEDPSSMFSIEIVIDLIIICILIFMIARGRKKEEPVIYTAPPVAPATPGTAEPYNRSAGIIPAAVIGPSVVLAPTGKAKLVLPDNHEIAIDETVKTIGRNDLEKLVTNDSVKYISRRHIAIKSDGGRYYVEDQNSANGTKLNDVNIKGMGKQELRDGDKIELADAVVLTFKVAGTV